MISLSHTSIDRRMILFFTYEYRKTYDLIVTHKYRQTQISLSHTSINRRMMSLGTRVEADMISLSHTSIDRHDIIVTHEYRQTHDFIVTYEYRLTHDLIVHLLIDRRVIS